MPLNTLSGNPYAKPNPLSKPLYAPAPKPTSTTVGNVSVNTTKPVLLQTQQGDEPIAGDDLQKTGFWASKTKKQKTMIIVGGIAVVSLIAFIALKKK